MRQVERQVRYFQESRAKTSEERERGIERSRGIRERKEERKKEREESRAIAFVDVRLSSVLYSVLLDAREAEFSLDPDMVIGRMCNSLLDLLIASHLPLYSPFTHYDCYNIMHSKYGHKYPLIPQVKSVLNHINKPLFCGVARPLTSNSAWYSGVRRKQVPKLCRLKYGWWIRYNDDCRPTHTMPFMNEALGLLHRSSKCRDAQQQQKKMKKDVCVYIKIAKMMEETYFFLTTATMMG